MTKELKSLYLIYSHDRLFLDEALERLEGRFRGSGDVDKTVFYAREQTVQELIQSAKTPSLLADRRLLVFHDIQRLLKADIKLLEEYAKDPSGDALVVLVAVAEGMHKNTKTNNKDQLDQALKALPKELAKLVEVIEKKGQVFEFSAPTAGETPRWVREQLKAGNVMISADAVDYIIDNVGYDFGMLKKELEKIFLYAEEDTEIGIDEIAGLIRKSAESGVFDLINALSERHNRQAFLILERLLSQGEAPMKMINLIARHFRLLLLIRTLLDKGVAQRDLVNHINGFSPWQISKNVPATNHFSIGELKDAFLCAFDTEVAIKTGLMDERTALEMLCSRIAGRKR